MRTLRRLVTEFSDFARLPRAELAEADLVGFLEEQCDRIRRVEDGADRGIDSVDPRRQAQPALVLTCKSAVVRAPTLMDQQMLRRALVNLVRNAIEAARDDHRVQVTVAVSLNRDGDSWVLDIDDDGPGIYDELRDVIFDPYFTTKHSGTGLGLAIVKKAIVEHGGSIENSVGNLGGAAFRVRLPIPGASPNESRIDVAQAGSSARTIGTQHEQ